MPVIALYTPKGGAGKSTSALVIGSVLPAFGKSAIIVDCDPNGTIVDWASMERSDVEVGITGGGETPQKVIQTIRRAREAADYVIVDTEGVATSENLEILSEADLVIVPMQATKPDAAQAVRAIKALRSFPEPKPYRVLVTRTSPAIPTRNEKMLLEEMREGAISILKTQLNQRAAFASLFTYGQSLGEMSPKEVSGLEAAIKNADELVLEIMDALEEGE